MDVNQKKKKKEILNKIILLSEKTLITKVLYEVKNLENIWKSMGEKSGRLK